MRPDFSVRHSPRLTNRNGVPTRTAPPRMARSTSKMASGLIRQPPPSGLRYSPWERPVGSSGNLRAAHCDIHLGSGPSPCQRPAFANERPVSRRFTMRKALFLLGDLDESHRTWRRILLLRGPRSGPGVTLARPPRLGGRVPRLQTALRQSGRDEEAELCEAAARQGGGERNVQRYARAASKGAVEFKASQCLVCRLRGKVRKKIRATPKTPSKKLWHSLNMPLPRAPSERGLQHG